MRKAHPRDAFRRYFGRALLEGRAPSTSARRFRLKDEVGKYFPEVLAQMRNALSSAWLNVEINSPQQKIPLPDFPSQSRDQSALRSDPGMHKAVRMVRNCDRKIGRDRLGKEPKNVPNPWVQFRIDDVYVPEPVQILMELHGKELLRGKIIDVSDADGQKEAFAVVEVEGLSQPVVVPMKHIKGMRP